MVLGTVDFSGVKDFEPIAGTFDGQTNGWKDAPTKAGDSINIEAGFSYEDDEGSQRKFTHRYNLKPQSLWSIKRDLIKLGADPTEFEGTDVDLPSILNRIFGPTPTPVKLTFSVAPSKDDPNGRPFQQMDNVELREV